METLEQVWEGDLFDRRQEAEDVIGYLESVTTRPILREDGRAHVLAVDTTYGQGKTFFLTRLDRHLRATEHVSAYVDAWVDDLEDEPLVALAATLESALAPWIEKSDAVASGFATFKAKAGTVAKLTATGVVKRVIGLAITNKAVDLISDELAAMPEAAADASKEAIKDGTQDAIADAATELARPPKALMEQRIARFREGQSAIKEMRASLHQVVVALTKAEMKLPITIIVDELDRCRPTYAVKVLEEIKHLFDVEGVAFVLGLHGQQLAHSVSAAYGSSFDGSAYLRRFFSRRYKLRDASLDQLVEKLMKDLAIPTNLLGSPLVMRPHVRGPHQLAETLMIAELLRAFAVAARDTFTIMEMLQTSVALCGKQRVEVPYLLAKIVAHIRQHHKPLSELVVSTDLEFAITDDVYGRSYKLFSLSAYLDTHQQTLTLSRDALLELVNNDEASDMLQRGIAHERFSNLPSSHPARLENYDQLVDSVQRFTSAETA